MLPSARIHQRLEFCLSLLLVVWEIVFIFLLSLCFSVTFCVSVDRPEIMQYLAAAMLQGGGFALNWILNSQMLSGLQKALWDLA